MEPNADGLRSSDERRSILHGMSVAHTQWPRHALYPGWPDPGCTCAAAYSAVAYNVRNHRQKTRAGVLALLRQQGTAGGMSGDHHLLSTENKKSVPDTLNAPSWRTHGSTKKCGCKIWQRTDHHHHLSGSRQPPIMTQALAIAIPPIGWMGDGDVHSKLAAHYTTVTTRHAAPDIRRSMFLARDTQENNKQKVMQLYLGTRN